MITVPMGGDSVLPGATCLNQSGIFTLPYPDAAAHVVAAGDLPSLSTASIDALVTCWNDVRPWAAVTSYADRIAHPFLLSPEAVEAAIELDGSKALWRLLVASSDDRVVIIDASDTAPLDLNTPDDYLRATRNDPAS